MMQITSDSKNFEWCNMLQETKNIQIGELIVDLSKRSVITGNTEVTLTNREFEILYLLASSQGRVFSKEKEQIYDLVWEEPYSGDYNIVMSHIRNIREKIEDNPSKPIYIHVEMVVLLSKGAKGPVNICSVRTEVERRMVDSRKVKVDFSLEDMDLSEFKGKATYEQIKAYVLEQTGLKVSSLYIAQIKKKCGLDVLFTDMEVFNGQGNDTERY